MAKELKIYTKTGDQGETSLIGGSRVPKYHVRIEAYGTVDELNSFVGYLRDQLEEEPIRKELLEIQDRLFTVESLLASEEGAAISRMLPRLTDDDVTRLEQEMDAMNSILPNLGSFILPGGHPLVSLCHICRTVCRRAERLCIKLGTEYPVDAVIIRYLNRLSDYFFVLSRLIAHNRGVPELPWKARV